ncbi:D-ribulokinase [Marchantia polymorpha subsp. ruderalis]|uniref:FGGY carbohydrate kinase domain-containing protein n=2 Tax=Marchantia polymorpha TaxID=3197 RepID=A0AAF6BYW6_MARPO|nr:hypothetical protein MARPO_0003s0282 [Marchantia polymorpha]PTQ49436.1 hypothetical protein MARPO_0003s0282 [Marchantia polymorpha]BBN17200.1 hypothetical protein Mp_7g12740 [Marchantia polymorpha subsp. ruderalis]BBN17201.1 hypothetical protein Mp_7g12740 [Marchantia polymorpha subsp. ruderalis]|eukprot:PTQ49435.1 hypothetical protein MARPO_0003s0282 [Marchantia polymorpha]
MESRRSSAPGFMGRSSTTVPRPKGSAYLGVDVGTGSARAGVFNSEGKLLGLATSPIQMWKEGDCVEQSSTDIWLTVCAAVRAACKNANISGAEICGIGFAATCSLVAIGADDSPVSVSWSGDARRNVIVWMDHRAIDQAERINATKSPVLQHVGGALSPEMQPPKLLWVKENLKESWAVAFRWMDLSDWLTYRATGDDTRSLCTTVCKWTYLGHAHLQHADPTDTKAMDACGWDDLFWQEIGLGDLVDGQYAKIGRSVALPGHPLGVGLTPLSAQELGLLEGTPVGTSVIDAHAGGIGVLQSVPRELVHPQAEEKPDAGEVVEEDELSNRMVLVCGTSTCHMAVTKEKLFIPGVWGPYWSAMIPQYWLIEGGQSATGGLLEHLVEDHAIAPLLGNRAVLQKISIYEVLNNILDNLANDASVPHRSALTKELHVLPDFHGNRSPKADPRSKGMVSGMTLDSSEVGVALLYLAALQSIAYGTRQIVEHLAAHGLKVDTFIACGGLSKNRVYLQEHADILGCPVTLPRETECVLLGGAIIGAVAAKKYVSIDSAMIALNAPGLVVQPSKDIKIKKYHDAKYEIFKSLYEQQCAFREVMAKALE